MSNQSPCTDPPYPCTTLTLAEKKQISARNCKSNEENKSNHDRKHFLLYTRIAMAQKHVTVYNISCHPPTL